MTRTVDLPRIKCVEWTVFSPEEIARLAVLRVTSSTNISGGMPVAHSSCDLRLGTTDRRLPCATCGRGMQDCGGHYGIIQLAHPIYHGGFLHIILKILRVTCYYCSSLIVPAECLQQLEHLSRWDRKRCLQVAADSVRPGSTRCPSCDGQNPIYTRCGAGLKADFSKVIFRNEEDARFCQRAFTAADARVVLQHISDDHCRLLGFRSQRTRPERFVLLNMLVPPLLIRPSTALADGSRVRGVDDLTVKLGEIVKANHQAKLTLARESSMLLDKGLSLAGQQAIAELSFHVNAFFSNDGRASQQTSFQRSGLPFRSVMYRLKGKEGRIRGTMVGKRVNFSARTVVSPDPVIDADEIGVPECMAQVLTVPEMVTEPNLARLQRRVRIGPGSNEGAISVRKGQTNDLVLLTYADRFQAAQSLQTGDIVERPLRNGDVVLFNRQPSLHRGSILGQRVRLMPHLTFRVNLISSPSTNMDCDGDEMNLHVLQSPEAQLEARVLMLLPYQIVSPQANKPCMGLVQDGILGLYLLSHPDCEMTGQLFWSLVGTLQYPSCTLDMWKQTFQGSQTFRGLDLLSLLFPKSLNYERRNLQGERVLIIKGVLKEGRLDKSVLGTSSNSLTHHMWLFMGPTRCMHFLSDGQRLACHYLQHVGFSISLKDCRLRAQDRADIKTLIKQAEKEAGRLLEQSLRDEQDSEPAIAQLANAILTNVGQLVAARLTKTNMLSQTVACGSKGNLINVAQILGCVGQQVLEGKRICGVKGQQPLLPLPPKLGLLDTHGFVGRSYAQGLNESQFFFHTMAGREGLIDTSVKTANSGYLQRRLMRALETLQVHEDLSVRNARGDIVQPCYGCDGFDAAFLLKTSLKCLEGDLLDLVLQGQAPECSSTDEQMALAQAVRTLLQFRGYRWSAEISPDIISPLNVDQALGRTQVLLETLPVQERTKRAREEPETHVARLQKLLSQLRENQVGQAICQALQVRWMLRSNRRVHLQSNLLVRELLQTPKSWEILTKLLLRQLFQARVRPGEMVGAIAGQSIGSDATQMTLNVFHHAGVASKDVTLGIHRLKELTDCIKMPRLPQMSLPLHQSETTSLRTNLCLGDLLLQEPYIRSSLNDISEVYAREALLAEQMWCETLHAESEGPPPRWSSWVLHLALDPQRVLKAELTPESIAAQIMLSGLSGGASSGPLLVAYAQPEMPQWFLLICSDLSSSTSTSRSEPYVLSNQCRQLTLSGTPKIRRSRFANQPMCYWYSGQLRSLRHAPFQITEGSCLRTALQDSSCIREHTRCNDVVETYQVLGIEAAAVVLFDELIKCIQFDGSYINPRHVLLLVDRMTCLGHLLPISRHGLNRLTDSGVLARCSFEETCDQLLEAAAFGEGDNLLGVTENVCLGQLSRIGTSFSGTARWQQEAHRRFEQECARGSGESYDVPKKHSDGLDQSVLSELMPEEPPTPRSWLHDAASHLGHSECAEFPFHGQGELPSAGAQLWGALSDNPVHLSPMKEPEDGTFCPSSPRLFIQRASLSQQL